MNESPEIGAERQPILSRMRRIAVGALALASLVSCSAALDKFENITDAREIITPDMDLPEPLNFGAPHRTVFCSDVALEECDTDEHRGMVITGETPEFVEMKNVPLIFQDVLIASEDRRFKDHFGVDTEGAGRALVVNAGLSLEEKDIVLREGFSTITMQVLEELYGFKLEGNDFERIISKFQEARFALALERALEYECAEENSLPLPSEDGTISYTESYSGQISEAEKEIAASAAYKIIRECVKIDKIFYVYANTEPTGRGARGLKQAAQKFFDVDNPINLTDEQSIMIAEMYKGWSNRDLDAPKGSEAYNRELEQNFERYQKLVGDLVETGKITEEYAKVLIDGDETGERGYDAMIDTVVDYVPIRNGIDLEPSYDLAAAHFMDFASKRAAEMMNMSREELAENGYTIITTLDEDLQRAAMEEIKRINDNGYGYEAAMTAASAIGRILAMVGGLDYEISQVNIALGPEGGANNYNIGSVVKIGETAILIENGATADSQFPAPKSVDLSIPGEPYFVDRADGCSAFGRANNCQMSVKEAVGVSSNTFFANTMLDRRGNPVAGAQDIFNMFSKFGSDIQKPVVPSYIVGSNDSVLGVTEMANSIFLNEGGHRQLEPIKAIYDNRGQLVLPKSPPPPASELDKVLSREESEEMTDIFFAPILEPYGTANGAITLPPYKVVGKTGTAPCKKEKLENGDEICRFVENKETGEFVQGNATDVNFVGSVSDRRYGGVTMTVRITGDLETQKNLPGITSKDAARSFNTIAVNAGLSNDDTTLLSD